jgi:hypothetical protein
MVLVDGSLRFDEFSDAWRVQARSLQSLAMAREQRARRLLIDWPQGGDHKGAKFFRHLPGRAQRFDGGK